MNYILYTGNNCHQCKEVIDFLTARNISYREVNIDEHTQSPPINLFIFPALFLDDTLIAYGIDILNVFKS